jgi:phosphotransferase system enzyme I (PtsI)
MEQYYRPGYPTLLKIIRSVTKTIDPETKDLAICGEIAGDPYYVELLLGLGLRCFSVAPTEILEVKNIIRSVSLPEAETMARQALTMSTALEVEVFWRRGGTPRIPAEANTRLCSFGLPMAYGVGAAEIKPR